MIMEKTKQFESAIRTLEEMAKIGHINGATISIRDEALVSGSHIGSYYKLASDDTSGEIRHRFYEKEYRFKFSTGKIQVYLMTHLTPKEIERAREYEEKLNSLKEEYKITP